MKPLYYILAGIKITAHDAKIISFAIKGWLRKNIATELKISENTLDTEMRILYAKLQVHTNLELYKLATHNGFNEDGTYNNLPMFHEEEEQKKIEIKKDIRKKPRERKVKDHRTELF